MRVSGPDPVSRIAFANMVVGGCFLLDGVPAMKIRRDKIEGNALRFMDWTKRPTPTSVPLAEMVQPIAITSICFEETQTIGVSEWYGGMVK